MPNQLSSNYYTRIERVQKWYAANPGLHVNDLLEEMSDTPSGTLSSLISYMCLAGHLLRHRKGFYTLPELVVNAKSVAYDIAKNKKAPSLFTRKRKKRETVAPINPDPLNTTSIEPLNLYKGKEFETIQVKIQKAIQLLKSNGYKILAKKIEYTEI